MLTALIGRIVIILFGVLNPSYRTYKAIKRKDFQEVVILGMYWVVFGIFITVELITDIFLQWVPFYHEMKIAFVIWLVTPATSGYSIIYRRLIHPELSKRESEIDDAIHKATEQGYTKVVEFGAKGLNYAAKTVLSTALMGQDFIADHLRRRSASMVDLSRPVHPSYIARRGFGAGDSRDPQGISQLQGFPSFPVSPDEDPFALNWLNREPTGSLGHQWRPMIPADLHEVPEDAEISPQPVQQTTASSLPPRRPGRATQMSHPNRQVNTRRSVQQRMNETEKRSDSN